MIELLVQTHAGDIWEISELVTGITVTERLNNGCSKLEFSYINNDIETENGCVVRFKYGDYTFVGRIFKNSHNEKGEVTVTAYDQLRYAKAKDTIVIQEDTVTSLTKRMCNYMKFTIGTIIDTKYRLATNVADDKTWLDIVYSAISETLTYTGKLYCLRDEAGEICLRDVEDMTLNLVLGDKSLVYGYDYSKSIDDEFYNLIKIYVPNKPGTSRDDEIVVVKDAESEQKYGPLQYFELADEQTNKSQARFKAENLLKLYNREKEILSLSCLGDTSVRAGTSFYGSIEDIKLGKRLIVSSVTHSFIPVHTMTVDVLI
ncbi:MAG: XkdQ/YqbQ family protein [Acetivibrionales bacterium]|jgi:hypothetical protein